MSETAEEIVIQQAMGLVRRTCRRVLGDADRADDAVQAVFLVYWRRRRQVAVHPQPLAWFQRTAVLVCRQAERGDRRRRFHERQAAQLQAEQADGDRDVLAEVELARQVEQALAELAPKYAEVLQRSIYLEQTQQTIAEQLQLPLGTVASWIRRGQALLERNLRRRGLGLAGGVVAAVLAPGTVAAATAPAPLAAPTGLSLDITRLAEAALRAMAWAKAKVMLAAAALLLLIGGGVGAGIAALEADPTALEPIADGEPPATGSTPPAWQDPQARAMLAFIDPDQPWYVAVDTRHLVGLLQQSKPGSLWWDPAFAEQRAGWLALWQQWRWWDPGLAPLAESLAEGGALVMTGRALTTIDDDLGQWRSRSALGWLHDTAASHTTWRPYLQRWQTGRTIKPRQHASGFTGVAMGQRTDPQVILWRDGIFAVGSNSEVIGTLEAGAGLTDRVPATPVATTTSLASLVPDLQHPAMADILPLIHDEQGEPLVCSAGLTVIDAHLASTFTCGFLSAPLQAPRAELANRLQEDAALTLMLAVDHEQAAHPLLRTLADAIVKELLGRERGTADAEVARWLSWIQGEVMLSADWQPADPWPSDLRCLIGHRDAAAVRQLLATAIAAGLPVREVPPSNGAVAQWVVDLGIWQAHIALDDAWLAVSRRAELLPLLMAPVTDAEELPTSLALNLDLPAMLAAVEPLWPLLRKALEQPQAVTTRPDYMVNRMLADMAGMLAAADKRVVTPTQVLKTYADNNRLVLKYVWLPLLEPHGDRAFSVVRFGRRADELRLIVRNGPGFELIGNGSPQRFIDTETLQQFLQDHQAKRVIGPGFSELVDLALPALPAVDASLLPSAALVRQHLPTYALTLSHDRRQWQLSEQGLPLATTTLAVLAASLQVGEFDVLGRYVWQRRQAESWQAVATRHQERITILRQTAAKLRRHLEQAGPRPPGVRGFGRRVIPRSATDLLDWGLLTPADLVTLAGRPLADRQAQALVGRFIGSVSDPAYVIRPRNYATAQWQRMVQSGGFRWWSVPLEPNWYAVLTNPALEVVVVYLPFELQPTDQQRDSWKPDKSVPVVPAKEVDGSGF